MVGPILKTDENKCIYESFCNFKKSSGCLSKNYEEHFVNCMIYKFYKDLKNRKK